MANVTVTDDNSANWADTVNTLLINPRILDQDTLNYLRRYLNDVVMPEA